MSGLLHGMQSLRIQRPQGQMTEGLVAGAAGLSKSKYEASFRASLQPKQRGDRVLYCDVIENQAVNLAF